MTTKLPNQDIQFQPQASGYSYNSTNPQEKRKRILNTFFVLVGGIFLFIFIFFVFLSVLNYFNIISLDSYIPKITGDLPKATPTPNPIQTSLTILENTSDTEANILINTGDNKVTSVELELKYEPGSFKNVDILPGDFMSTGAVTNKKIDQINGTVTFSIEEPRGIWKTGEGILAVLTFSPANTQLKSSIVRFLSGTKVNALGFKASVLKSTSNGVFSFPKETPASPSAQASPSANLQ